MEFQQRMHIELIDLPVVSDPRGNLSFIQSGGLAPFDIKRCYWIYDVPGGKVRHGRALKSTYEMIVALSGSFDAVIDGQSYHLCRGYQGLLVPPMHWRELINFSTNAVALVLANKPYSEDDYIREYKEYEEAVRHSEYREQIGKIDTDDALIDRNSDSHKYSKVDDCVVIDLPKRIGENGNLTEVEDDGNCPFKIKRVYYLYDVPADSSRGGHSHYEAESLIVAVSGSFDVVLDDGCRKKTVTLNRPYKALHLRKGIWRRLDNFSAGSVCLVVNSEKYDEEDYVRDYSQFISLTRDKRTENVEPRYPFLNLATVNAPYMEALKVAAANVIESGRYIGGPEIDSVEEKLREITDTEYAVGVSTGLDALRLILRGYIELGRLKPGDEVIVPANTFIASVLAITDNNLVPVFVEPDIVTMNLDSDKVEAAITVRTGAIMPVHLYGCICWNERLGKIARNHNLLVIEDNAQAIGAKSIVPGLFGTHRSGGLGHAGAFSFYPTKNVGALGDAGAITTHDKQLAEVVKALRNYGSDRQYHNIYAGLNCRLDPIQAAMISVKLPYVDKENEHRRSVAEVYDSCITNPLVIKPLMPLRTSGADSDAASSHVWHQYVVRVANRDVFRKYLLDKGVETNVHYPVAPFEQPCYRQMFADMDYPIASKLANEVVSLPVSSCTSLQDAKEISEIINGYTNTGYGPSPALDCEHLG